MFATAISISFTGHAQWVSYLLGFAGVFAAYWLVYAPAKWGHKDNLLESELHVLEDRKVVTGELVNPLLESPGWEMVWRGSPARPVRRAH